MNTYQIIIFLLCIPISAQEILWERTFGGDKSEYLNDMKSTPDFGFILAGSSLSNNSGNKLSNINGDLDYFIWKLDKNGIEEWQRSFGGSGSDQLYSINLTRDGGYILGGSSTSSINGDKLTDNQGIYDYWILKISPNGKEEWQATFGGKGNDILFSIQQTKDNGYIIGGSSNSPKDLSSINGKSEHSRGGMDFWIIKISELGKLEWQRTLGGSNYDILKSIKQTFDEGYILGGDSNSSVSKDKVTKSKGKGDFWIVRLNKEGDILWEKSMGREGEDNFKSLVVTEDNHYILAGDSQEINNKSMVNVNWWVIKISDNGEIIWEKDFDYGNRDRLVSISQTNKGNYLLSGFVETNTHGVNKQVKGIEDYLAIKINENGDKIWQKQIGGKSSDRLQKAITTRNGGYVLAGTSNSKKSRDKKSENYGQEDFWIVKIADKEIQSLTDFKKYEIYPNPAEDFVNVLIHDEFAYGNIKIFDMLGVLILEQSVKNKITPLEVRDLPIGMYVIKIETDLDEFSTKLLVK